MASSGLSIGLDIDEKSIKFAKIKQINGETTLIKFAIKDVASQENKSKAISDILKEIFKDEKADIPVYTSAFGTNITLKRISIPIMPDEEIPQAIKWEAKNLVPFPTDNASIAYYKIGQVSEKAVEKYDIMFAVAAEEMIDFFNSTAKDVGIKFAGITALPFALCSLLKLSHKCEPDKVHAIIDIGSEAASLSIFKGETLQFAREITVAGDSFTKAMTGLLVADQWQLNLTYDQSEEIKKKYGVPKKDTSELTDSGIPLIHIYEMLAPTLRRLQNEILRSFDYYKEQFREEKIDNIFLTGGSSSIKNLEESLSNAFGIRVETINPLESIKVASEIDMNALKDQASRLSLALGLAIEKGEKINLLKAKEKKAKGKISLDDLLKTLKIDKLVNETFLKNVKFNIPAVPVNFLAILGVLTIAGILSYNIYLSGIRDTYKRELASKQAILNDVKTLIERKAIFDQISLQESRVKDALTLITMALPSGVILTDLFYENSSKLVTLSGIASDTNVVGKIMKGFEDSPNFKRTTLIEARKTTVDNVERIIFKITFNLT